MSQRDLDTRLRSWARSPAGRPVPMELRRQVLDIPTTAPPTQRRRWLRFLRVSRPVEDTRDELDDGQLGRPAIAIAPTQTRGVITMFSPVKIVAAAAVLALSVGIASVGLFTAEPQAPGGGEAVTPIWTGDYFDSDEGLIAVTGRRTLRAGAWSRHGNRDHE